MSQLVLIKLGGSLITDKAKPLTANPTLIKLLGSELANIKTKYPTDLIVGTGAGSFGHYLVHKNKMGKTGSLPGKEQAVKEIHQAVAKLNKMIMQAIGPDVVQVDGKAVEQHDSSIDVALSSHKIVSVYGDIIARDATYEVLSTEELFELLLANLAPKYEKISVIFATAVPGVLDLEGKVITKLKASDIEHLRWHSQKGFDVTGGMRQKVEASIKQLKWADFVRIVDGREAVNLDKALQNNDIGTLIQ